MFVRKGFVPTYYQELITRQYANGVLLTFAGGVLHVNLSAKATVFVIYIKNGQTFVNIVLN